MASSGLKGAFALTRDSIDQVVLAGLPGNYALGKTKSDGVFYISRIGRSDDDVRGRLGDYLGQYAEFKFGYAASAAAAYLKECHLYHDFSPPDNAIHPDCPPGTNLTCPRCVRR
jgi:hypothetical protein